MQQLETLRDAIANLASIPDDATLFVERIEGRFHASSGMSVLVLTEEELAQPVQEVAAARAAGKDYFLESFVIVELLDEWLEHHDGGQAALDEFVGSVIHYAEYEAQVACV
jgi:hypothetical protein